MYVFYYKRQQDIIMGLTPRGERETLNLYNSNWMITPDAFDYKCIEPPTLKFAQFKP